MNPPSTTTHLQATEEFMVTEVDEEQTLEIPIVAQLLDEVNKVAQETSENPDDTKLEIKVVKSFFTSYLSEVQDQTMNDYKESAGIQEDFLTLRHFYSNA
ncbi:hypothetical protein Tco_0292018 [Tanacetum coccineum]